MTNENQVTQDEFELFESIQVSIERLQQFFTTNNIGARVGLGLINQFIQYAISGGASVGVSIEDATDEWKEQPSAKAVVDNLQPLIDSMVVNNKEVVENMFADNDDSFKHRELLKDAFMDTLFGTDQSKSKETFDGTAGVVAAMVISIHYSGQPSLDARSKH
ncbi:TPA: hypothetical protein ACGSTL_001305 [Vibrio parahaemolyticus]|uniref:hypothetical protein n=1 Tax=Vibrio campbellii TaxID=680 RepID=UPI001F078F45|nr:hypothetical protein [Vibrio campbellii]UMM06750.1 hypothetical protein MKR81_26180 [Vibrio campbellii]